MNKDNSMKRLKNCVCQDNSSSLDEMIEFNLNGEHEAAVLMKRLCELREHGTLTDGIIKTSDGQTLRVNRCILAAASPYFEALFKNTLDENNPNQEVFLPDIRFDIMKIIVNYIYTGNLSDVSIDLFENLLIAVDRLRVLGAVDACHQFLIDSINYDSCIGIYRMAKTYFAFNVSSEAKKFILHKFVQLLNKNQDYLLLTFEEILEILGDDRLNVEREEMTYEAMMNWISFEDKRRARYFPELIKLVRFGNSKKKFVQTVYDNALVKINAEIQNYLGKVDEVLTDLEQDPIPDKFKPRVHPFLRPRVPCDIIFTYGGWGTSHACNYLETYDSRVNKWYLMDEIAPKNRMQAPYRAYHGMVYFRGLIYIIGGFNGHDYFNTVKTFNPRTRIWKDRSCMHYPRCYVSVAVCDNYVYAMGGFDGNARTNTVERYDYLKNQWESVTDMHHPRSDAAATSLNGKIYIAGGFNGENVLASCEIFDPNTNEWTLFAEMNRPRSGVQLANHNGYLYVVAGNDGQSRQTSIEKYDFLTNQWRLLTHMQTPRSNCACIVMDDKLFVIGGFNGTTTISDVEAFDLTNNTWTRMWPMNFQRSALSACLVSELDNAKEYTWLRSELIEEKQLPFIAYPTSSRRSRTGSA